MKTSNKILTVFLLIIFLIPVSLLLGLRSEIKKGNYTLVNQERYGGNGSSGKLAPYTVIRIIAPGPQLKCDIYFSDSPSYTVMEHDERDSAHIYNSGDTLIVQFLTIGLADQDGKSDMRVRLNLPSVERLIVDNAEVNIPLMDIFLNENFNAEVNGKGLLKLDMGLPNKNAEKGATADTSNYRANEWSVRTTNGTLSLLDNIKVRHLDVQAQGSSTLTITNTDGIGEITGSLSDSTTVSARWKFLQRMSTNRQ